MCSDPARKHCSEVQGTLESPLFKAALQNRLSVGSVSLQIHLWSCALSYRCAVTQNQCTAALFRAKWSPHCSVLLHKTGSQQAVYPCSYTYGNVLFIQVCSDPAQMRCSKVQGKLESPLFSTALQNRLSAGSVSLRLHLWRCALHTGVQ